MYREGAPPGARELPQPLGANATMTRPFGRAPDGKPATLHLLTTPGGWQAEVCDWGGIVHRLTAPGGESLLLSLQSVEAHAEDRHYIGVLIGRVANRIEGGRVPELALRLPCNAGGHHLHGGPSGLHAQRFGVQRLHDGAIRLFHHSPDGAGGYPGALDLSVAISLSDSAGLGFSWSATTTAQTLFAPTFHGYWDLSGRGDLQGHRLRVEARRVVAVDAAMTVAGVQPVEGPLDLRRGAPFLLDHPDLEATGGIDHCFLLDETSPAATLRHPACPWAVELETDRPGLQVYTANVLDTVLADGARRGRHSALCLEPGPLPDAPNQPGFPSIGLRPGQTYRSVSSYRFRRVST